MLAGLLVPFCKFHFPSWTLPKLLLRFISYQKLDIFLYFSASSLTFHYSLPWIMTRLLLTKLTSTHPSLDLSHFRTTEFIKFLWTVQSRFELFICLSFAWNSLSFYLHIDRDTPFRYCLFVIRDVPFYIFLLLTSKIMSCY